MTYDPNAPLGYRVPQVSQKTGFGRSFIYEEIRAGNLIARKAGGCTIVLHSDLEAYLNNLPRL
ncbi:MAG: helix-turn-helix domain-containing protein [Alphaproteobacteria bacterium]|nr:helix-turn-helix domain-containing protein [Alphaproteobacteria bacterium]